MMCGPPWVCPLQILNGISTVVRLISHQKKLEYYQLNLPKLAMLCRRQDKQTQLAWAQETISISCLIMGHETTQNILLGKYTEQKKLMHVRGYKLSSTKRTFISLTGMTPKTHEISSNKGKQIDTFFSRRVKQIYLLT
mmetsp:Transcript_36683/g.74837  ORF Transcript_36683/g.74837 Transcript_36683/m.74837 type:complete len:138 (-) Transcript_36683:23-436(-)